MLYVPGIVLLAAAALLAIVQRLKRGGSTAIPVIKPQPAEPPLLMLTEADPLTRHQLYEGVLGIGGTGSGKSSTLAHLQASMMASGAGMLILTAKTDDYLAIEKLARAAGRERDLFRFGPGKPWRFDFLRYELGAPGGSVATASQLLQDLVDTATRMKAENSKDPFWPQAAARQQRMALIPIVLATGTASVRDLYRYISSLPQNRDQVADDKWKQSAYCVRVLVEALDKHPHNEDLGIAADYAMEEYPALGEKTSAGITATSVNVLEKFMSGDVGSLVASGETNLSPDDILDGRIVVVDCPALKYREPGQFIQLVWKLCTIRAVLRRDLAVNPRDVCIYADECQLHAVPSVDSMTQAVARSHRLINVAITQNINLLQSVFHSKEDAHAWCSNLMTKFIFANPDMDTNNYFSALLGQSKQLLMGGSSGGKPYDPIGEWMGESGGSHTSFNENWQPDVRPEFFVGGLRKGGRENGFLVDCIVTQGGRRFSNGKTWVKASFRQKV
jgi:hypothetical protein